MPLKPLTAALFVAAVSAGCVTAPPAPQPSPQDELTRALKDAATRAVDVRVRLASMQPLNTSSAGQPETPVPPTSRIDIDYVGPVETATRLLARTLGWDMSVNGKKRAETIVSLRHEQQDAITIMRDIGVQCASKCDIHLEVVEGGKSSVALSYRD